MTWNPFYQNTKWEKHKPKAPSTQMNQLNTNASTNAKQQTANEGAAAGTLGQFEGPTTSSPYYKSLLATGTDATTNAYNNAKATSAARANAAGFGDNQPVTQGANNEINAQESASLARLPMQAEQATAPLQLEAANTSATMAGNEANASNTASGTSGQLSNQYQQMQQAFQNSLLQAGLGVATGPLGVKAAGNLAPGVFG
jgi:hypothetical protein